MTPTSGQTDAPKPPKKLIAIGKASFRACKAHNLVYMQNAKAGCSTIKGTLWREFYPESYRRKINVHDLEASPFVTGFGRPWAKSAKVFAIVRNPYSRVVSAYLDKIARPGNPSHAGFCKSTGLDPSEEISFARFIDLISKTPHDRLNGHWRPQYINILWPVLVPHRIGYLETLDEDLSAVFRDFAGLDGVKPEVRRGHKTNSREAKAELLADASIRRKIEELYHWDFAYFGYARDPAISAPERRATTDPDLATAKLMAFLQAARHGGRRVNGKDMLVSGVEDPVLTGLIDKLRSKPTGRKKSP